MKKAYYYHSAGGFSNQYLTAWTDDPKVMERADKHYLRITCKEYRKLNAEARRWMKTVDHFYGTIEKEIIITPQGYMDLR